MTAIKDLNLTELRSEWCKYWGMPAHKGLGRAMLEASLQFKQWERDTGGLPKSVQKKLHELLSEYRNNCSGFNPNQRLKPGTRLERIYKGQIDVCDSAALRSACMAVPRDNIPVSLHGQ